MPFENLLNISFLKKLVDCLSAILTPTVAIVGLYIAYRQRLVEEARFRHDLFERRYRQFKAVGDFVRAIIIRREKASDNEIVFLSEIAEMQFIFDKEISSYVREQIWLVACKIDVIQGLERQQEERANLRQNLNIFEKKVLPYMQLQQPSLLKKLAALWEKIQKAAE